jgi:hypothetical protein
VALDCNSSILKLLAAGEFPPSHKAESEGESREERKLSTILHIQKMV